MQTKDKKRRSSTELDSKAYRYLRRMEGSSIAKKHLKGFAEYCKSVEKN